MVCMQKAEMKRKTDIYNNQISIEFIKKNYIAIEKEEIEIKYYNL